MSHEEHKLWELQQVTEKCLDEFISLHSSVMTTTLVCQHSTLKRLMYFSVSAFMTKVQKKLNHLKSTNAIGKLNTSKKESKRKMLNSLKSTKG